MKTLQTVLESLFDDNFGVDSNAAVKQQIKNLLKRTYEMWNLMANKHKEPAQTEVNKLNEDWNNVCEVVAELCSRARKSILYDTNVFVMFDEQRLKYILTNSVAMNGFIGFEFKSGKPYRYGKIENQDITNNILKDLKVFKLPESILHYRNLFPIMIKNLS